MQNYKKDIFPVDVQFEKYPFIDGKVLNARQLDILQNNISNTFEYIENLINLISDKTSEGLLEKLLGYKGTVNCEQLKNISEENNGNIYILEDSDLNIQYLNTEYKTNFFNKDIILCCQSFNVKEVSSNNFVPFNERWVSKNNILETASEIRSGIVNNILQYFSGIKVFLDGIVLRGEIFEVDTSNITIKENGIEKELTDKGSFKKLQEAISNLEKIIDQIYLEPISSDEINNLFL